MRNKEEGGWKTKIQREEQMQERGGKRKEEGKKGERGRKKGGGRKKGVGEREKFELGQCKIKKAERGREY